MSVSPDAAAALADAESLVPSVDARRVELARLRIAMLLGDTAALAERSATATAAGVTDETVAQLAQWPTSELFDRTDRACLGLAEQFVIDVSGVTDEDVQPVLEGLGAAGLYGFVQSLWVSDMGQRLEMALSAVLDESPDSEEEAE
jgi:alkylhydroperoxidase family enzyme